MRFTWMLALSCLIVVTAKHHSRANCGLTMEEGFIKGNCSGSFIVLYRGQAEVKSCSSLQDFEYYSPVSVTIGNCSVLLLDHANCATDNAKSPCYASSQSGAIAVMILSIVVLLSAVVVMVLFQCSMKKEGLSWSDVKISRGKVMVYEQEDVRTYSLLKFLVLFLVCSKPVDTYCVEPYSSHLIGSQSFYNYRLRVSQDACFEGGKVMHLRNEESYALDHMFNTGTWKEHIWSYNGCGNGPICGNMEDCGAYGVVGRVIEEKTRIYKKVCRSYSVGIFSCISYWACWVATQEVIHGGVSTHKVYSIGESENEDYYEKLGLEDCELGVSSQRPLILTGKFLVVENTSGNAWLCASSSDPSFPQPGKLGDLQIKSNMTHFNFDAFKCELDSTSSSGGCKVEAAFIDEIKNWCSSLPVLMDGGSLVFREGKLSMINSGFDDFTLKFYNGSPPVLSNHNCYSKTISIEGFKDDGGMFMYIFSALSGDNSTWVIHSDCSPDPIEIVCDGSKVAYHLMHSDDTTCVFDGQPAADNRKDTGEVKWVWDEGDHMGMLTGFHVSKWVLVCLFVIAVVMVLRCVFK
nr:MAG: glycoprotein [Aedes japonicus bunyavirus 1]